MKHSPAREPLDLQQALHIVREYKIAIRATPRSIALWRAASPIPRQVREALIAHKSEVRALLASADISVCPSPDNHRKYWARAEGQQYYCEMCKQLAPWIDGDTKHKNQVA